MLTADVVSTDTANTLKALNGLSFPVVAGVLYTFEATIFYTSVATTTGSRWTINGPTATVCYQSEYTLTATTSTRNAMLQAYNLPAACNATSVVAPNMALIKGFVKPTVDGTVVVQFASEVANSAITAKTVS